MAGANRSKVTQAACQAKLSADIAACLAKYGAATVATGVQAVGTWINNNQGPIIGTTVVVGVVILVVATDGGALILLPSL